LSEAVILTAVNINTAPPEVGTSVITQVEVISGDSIVTGNPVVGTSNIGQTNSLVAGSIITGIPTVGVSTVTVNYGLTGVSILTGNPVVGIIYMNASGRRVVSITGDSTNSADLAELHNYADLNNEYNRVA
jgi:hypothetical protein